MDNICQFLWYVYFLHGQLQDASKSPQTPGKGFREEMSTVSPANTNRPQHNPVK